MKMYLGDTPINGMNIKHFEISTNDCTMVASDLQAGKTAVAKGRKITGTGKSFEFAYYGAMKTNQSAYVPNNINVVEVAAVDYPVQLLIALSNMKDINFTTEQTVANIVVDGVSYPLVVKVENNIMTLTCNQTINIEIFYGKDNYI